MAEIDNQGLTIISEVVHSRKQVQALDPSLAHYLPLSFLCERGVFELKLIQRVGQAQRDKCDLAVLQIATLSDNNQPRSLQVLINNLPIAWITLKYRQETVWQQVSLS